MTIKEQCIHLREEGKTYNEICTILHCSKSIVAYQMNDHYNPTRDIDRAIKLHNPGAGKWYGKRIKDRMELIRFSEALRFKIVELYDN